MQQKQLNITLVTPTAAMSADAYGGRAKCLQRLVRLDLPVPRTVALPFEAVHEIASGIPADVNAILGYFDHSDLICVRPSSQSADWGGPGAVLNIGMNKVRYALLCDTLGAEAAAILYLSFVQSYSIHVARLDADIFDHIKGQDNAALEQALRAYEEEAEEVFPQERDAQLTQVLASMARAWEGTSARLLRQAKGAPAGAGLGLVVQQMAFGLGQGECGSGLLQLVNSATGQPQVTGRYKRQSQGREGLSGDQGAIFLTSDSRGASLQEAASEIFETLIEQVKLMRTRLREEMQVEFTIQDGQLFILDGVRVQRRAPAAVRIAVALAEDGIISQKEALLRVDPRSLGELLHRQVDPDAARDVLCEGMAASPGAAAGKIVFTSEAAQASAARNEACVLVRRETSPEDIRGMHAASAVLTERGGMTSHAAVIGRGIGLPCVVGANEISLNLSDKTLTTPNGQVFKEGDVITVDGTNGQILAGQPEMIEAALNDAFQSFMSWADTHSDIRVRANADTPADAQTARNFNAHGIGLCRTEHMFFEADRLTLMREMIFADDSDERRAVLDRLLPMQRSDFIKLFKIMQGMPVCIRLFDPPLHEFLPSDRAGIRELADALDLPISHVSRRIEDMAEYNPMLGLRGVRLGVTVPEIYEMQAQAIFEATIEASQDGDRVVPEIMIPLVSAKREVELVKGNIDSVAARVRTSSGVNFAFKLGVMVETPRAALRANEIAQHSAFLSFGTNDLTQMTYGLSRDDAGRFMSRYVQKHVFLEDPFHVLDTDGVGELLQLGAERARKAHPDVTISICGEHGGNPESIAFSRAHGFDYVSCSPFRVPSARLAAAQLAIQEETAYSSAQ